MAFVHDVDNQLAVFLGHTNVSVIVLDGDELAFRGCLERVDDGADVYFVRMEVPELNFAIAQLPMVDGWDYLAGQRKRDIHTHKFMRAGIAYSYMQVAFRGSGPNNGSGRKRRQ
jgi:hypothetical protein